MAKNLDDLDLFVDIVNEHHDEVKNGHLNDIYDDAVKRSVTRSVVDYKKEKLEKPKGYKKIIISTAIILAMGFGLGVASTKVVGTYNTNRAVSKIEQEVDDPVVDNTQYGGYNPNTERPNWWYNIYDMASQVLETNLDYDIDTRIYGCYKAMKPYHKEEHMDKLLSCLNSLVHAEGSTYDEKTIEACSYTTFKDYLASKGLEEEEYQDLMQQILATYGRGNINNEELNELLQKLNGGSR